MVDYSKGTTAELPTADELTTITELARKLVRLERAVKVAGEDLVKLKAELYAVQSEGLPEAMKQVGLTEFALSNGAKITVKDKITCTITEDNRSEAYAWLREHGHGSIIKNDVIFSFGMGEDELHDVVVEYAEENSMPYSVKEAIHAGTLNAWAGRQIENEDADPIPEQVIGVFRRDFAKVTLAKKR